jgi:Endonuclease/Exonuclease/phosphatase family
MSKALKVLALVGTLCGLAGCKMASKQSGESASAPSAVPTVSVMTFNVENLFDTEDDPDRNDESFLPKDVKDASPLIRNRCLVQKSV